MEFYQKCDLLAPPPSSGDALLRPQQGGVHQVAQTGQVTVTVHQPVFRTWIRRIRIILTDPARKYFLRIRIQIGAELIKKKKLRLLN